MRGGLRHWLGLLPARRGALSEIISGGSGMACLGWQLLSIHISPPGAESAIGEGDGSRERVYFISQSIQLFALICVLAGTLAIWWGVYRLLVGFRLRWKDFRGIAVIAALVVWASSSHISLSHSGQGELAFLQVFGLGLLIAIGAVGLLLHSLSMQMGGGRLAMVMQWIAAYALTRSALTLWQGWGGNESLVWWLAFYSVPWIFALGAAYSCWLADTVKRRIRHQPYGDWDVSSLAE